MNETIAVSGVVPRTVATPHTIAELAAIVGECAARGASFAFVGGGTQLALGNRPTALDTIVRMTALDRVVDYSPQDQTITVEAGITFAALDRTLAEHGQMLPLDSDDRQRATIGGAIATNTSGRRRLRYGTARDMIVGVEIVRPDGTPSRGGGKVVKNVAGFDLPKLMVGSLGTLGAIATVTLRVYPVPDEVRYVVGADADDDGLVARDVAALGAAMVRERLEPVAMWATRRPDGRYGVVAEFAGSAVALDAQCATCLDCIAALGVGAQQRSDAALGEAETRARFAPAPRIRIAFAPGALEQLDDLVGPLLDAESALHVYPGVGVAFLRPGPQVDHADLLRRIRDRPATTAVVEAMPSDWTGVDAWGDPPRSQRLMRVVKATFDPRGLCNPGRFVGGL
jgi:glycolate oxidase FAD binding subunit